VLDRAADARDRGINHLARATIRLGARGAVEAPNKMTAAPETTSAPVDLTPYVPRVVVDWLRAEPEARRRELEGTLAFVDISGFTAMSERLAQKGKVGAEEVTEVMNRTFERLLDVAYGAGGGLLKFGGDALLLFFSGEQHAARACDAAYGMRKALRELGRPRTSVGPVTLKMHVGIHSDFFDFFLVGDSHRELLLTGPGVTRTVEMEAGAQAGEILVSDETAATLPERIFGDEQEGGRLLRSPPGALGAIEPLPPHEGIDLSVCVPGPVRHVIESHTAEPEHRQAAVAFVHFGGVDDLLGEQGAEELEGVLDELLSGAQQIADEHGVTFLETDIDDDGGKIILVAGAPQTEGDDEERILRTARGVADLETPLPLRIGVSRGRVFAGEVGAEFRRTYTILGTTAALAARLMGKAQAGQLLTTPDVLERTRSAFETTELEPLTLKGIAEPVAALDVHSVGGEAEAATERQLPFVGRERERAVLTAAVTPVRAGFGTLVELVGEPGIGKSRLADELQQECGDMRKLTVRCEQYESATPYHPFRPLFLSLLDVELNGSRARNREILSGRLAAIDEQFVPWAPLFAAPLDIEVESTPEVDALDPAFWRARLHGMVGKLLGHLLDSPTLLLFEDVHWMDDASSELLRYLGTQLPSRPWLACTTRRPGSDGFVAAEGNPPLPALSLRLEPLTEDDAKTLAQAAAGDRRLSDEELVAISERGGGNPLFLQELALPDELAEVEQLPDTVEALVATRIDRLDAADRALLRWASVLGPAFSGELIAEVLEGLEDVSAGSEAWDRLREFVEHDPETPGGFRFRHVLIRDAAYEGLSFKRRRDLHGRVAEVIEQRLGDRAEDESELLSLHFHRAEHWPEAWHYSVVAGRRADKKYANVEAQQFFERALEAAKRADAVDENEVAMVWESLGDVRMRLGDYQGAETAYRAARKVFPAGQIEQARLMQKEAIVPLRLAWSGSTASSSKQYSQSLRRLSHALRTLEDVEGDAAASQRARLFGWYALVLQHQRRPRVAIEWCQRTIAEGERSKTEDAVAHADFILDWAYVALGRREEAVHSARAVEIYERLEDYERLSAVLNNLGGYAYIDGRWDDAIELAERARNAMRKIGDDTRATIVSLNIADVRSDQGHLDEAESLLREVLEMRSAGAIPLAVAEAASVAGRHAARMGRFDEAKAHLEEARTFFAAEGDEVELLNADARLVECLLLEGAADEALALASEALGEAESTPGVTVITASLKRLLGVAHLQKGQLEEARAALEESLRLARLEDENFGLRSADYEIGLALGALVRLRELTGEPADDVTAERDAIFERLGVVAVSEPPLAH
jgi:class 3 adenylate cyclase/tetratricopeptide (TPR) repeat protein